MRSAHRGAELNLTQAAEILRKPAQGIDVPEKLKLMLVS
jgi:hypothetical protein